MAIYTSAHSSTEEDARSLSTQSMKNIYKNKIQPGKAWALGLNVLHRIIIPYYSGTVTFMHTYLYTDVDLNKNEMFASV